MKSQSLNMKDVTLSYFFFFYFYKTEKYLKECYLYLIQIDYYK